MIALTDDQLKLLMAAAARISLHQRDHFLRRFAASVEKEITPCASMTMTHRTPTTEMAS
jgi:hypothetical protein